jgi:peptidyl-prolyl cis-trans isomerase C
VRYRAALVCAFITATLACSRKESTPPPSPSPSAAVVAATPKPIPSPLPDVVAEVNGQPIRGMFLRAIAESQIRAGSVPAEQQAAVYRSMLDSLISRELLFQEALARKIAANAKLVRQAYDQPRSQFTDEAMWKEHLARQGFTPDSFRTEIRAQQTVRALVEAETAKITERDVSDTDVRAYYDGHPTEFDAAERLQASHILVTIPANADAATRERQRAKAQGLLDRARKGEDFAKLAREGSEDPGSAREGGRLPEFDRSRMVKPFADAAFALKPAELSGLVETQFGYHIIKLHKRIPAEHLAFDAVRERLRGYIVRQRQEQAVAGLVQQLHAKARIDVKI